MALAIDVGDARKGDDVLVPLGCLPRGAERRLDAALRELAQSAVSHTCPEYAGAGVSFPGLAKIISRFLSGRRELRSAALGSLRNRY